MRGVLWVTPEVPDRVRGGGGNLHQGRLLVEVARHVPVDLLVSGSVRDAAVRDAVRTLVEVPPAPPHLTGGRLRRRALSAFDAWARRIPIEVADAAPTRRRLATELDRLVGDVDAVLVHHQVLAPLVSRRWPSSPRRVLSLLHVSSVRAEQAVAVTDAVLHRALLRREAANSSRLERASVDAADALVTITDEDAERLARPPTPTFVVRHGVDLRPLGPLPADPVVLLAGSLDYEPNVDGAEWFAEAVWDRVVASVPGARLLVVGRNPAGRIRALARMPGIEVHPDVPDVAPFLAQARVAVVPLRIGTGVRVKALQALAAGVPLVGTSVGLEGTGASSEHAGLADEAGAFATEVIALLRDAGLADRRRRAGRALVETGWSWASSASTLLAALGAPC